MLRMSHLIKESAALCLYPQGMVQESSAQDSNHD